MPPALQFGVNLKPIKDPSQRDALARLRFVIIGPLLAAPPESGELHTALGQLATKTWRHPTSGLDVSFGLSTLERWYYAARTADDPVAALRNSLRGGIKRFPSLSQTVIDTLTQQYREHPGWTAQLHFDNLCAAFAHSGGAAATSSASRVSCVSSYPTIRRYLLAQGMFRQAQPKRATAGALAARDRLERLEVRSFEVDHVNALWHLDFHHGSRKVLTRLGEWVTPMILCVID
jgi:putative transposase